MKQILLSCVAIIYCNAAFAQCDTGFYNFNKSIISAVSSEISHDENKDTSKSSVFMEFRDFTSYKYIVGDPYNVGPFYCFRWEDSNCNNFPVDHPFEYRQHIKLYFASKASFESYMTSDVFGPFDTHKNEIYADLIEDPVEGWSVIEKYYFIRIAPPPFWQKEVIAPIVIDIPIYTFINRTVGAAYFFKVRLSNVTSSGIEILSEKKIALN